jgi:hypothetical protein
MKLSCLMPRGLTVLAAISLAICQAGSALAQYAPYGNAYQGHPTQAYQPQQAYQAPQAYAPYSNVNYNGGPQFMPGPQLNYSQQGPPSQNYTAPQNYAAQPQYVAMAHQPGGNSMPPIPQPMETVPPGPMQQQNNSYAPQPTPMNNSQGGYESYANGGGGYANGGGYGCEDNGNYNCPPSYGTCDMGCACAPRRHWFGGVYGLLMERVNCDYVPLAFATPPPAPGYYPTDDEIALTTADLEDEFMGGAEVRFGATFACCGGRGGYGGCCDPCGCDTGCGTLGWEVAYWALAEDESFASYTDTAGMRTYGMKSYQGLEAFVNGVYRPANHIVDYAPPVQDYVVAGTELRVTSVETSRSFSMQNLEMNLICLPTIGGGCAPVCDPCGGDGCCDPCGGGGCGHGGGGGHHFGGGCGAYCYTGPRCQFSSSLGVRYMQFDEDFMLRYNSQIWNMPADTLAGTYTNAHYIQADNNLIGFQIGGNGCYHLGCCGRMALHFGTNAGIYGNYIEVDQYMSGQIRFANGGLEPFNIMAEDENIAFAGELRLGASYQCTCNCRLYGGYRAMGVSGVALSTGQLTNSPYITPAQSSYIDCSGSIFLHGLQTGVEFCY